MSHVDDESRRQVLTRVAASRVRVVDAVESVRSGVQGSVRSFPLSATALKMAGVALGGLALTGVVAMKLAGKKKKPQPKPDLKARAVALQALSALAIPLLQRWLVSGDSVPSRSVRSSAAPMGKKKIFPDFNAMFYRWLGLSK